MKSVQMFFVAITAAAALSACAPAAQQAALDKPIDSKTQLLVDNQNWLDMDVYVVKNGVGQRLGFVEAMTKRRFRVPDAYILGVSDFQIAARAVGSKDQFVSDEIQVFPGAEINFRVMNVLSSSYFSVTPLGLRQ